jgi:transglutaminase-like putative cysteine protease
VSTVDLPATEWYGDLTPAAPPSGPPAEPMKRESSPASRPGRIRRALRDALPADRVLLALLALLAIVPFEIQFYDLTFLRDALGAVVVVSLVCLLSPKRPFALVLWLAVGALFVYLTLVVFDLDWSAVYPGVTGARTVLETTAPRFANEGPFLAGPVALAAIAAFIGIELAARTRLATLTTAPALGALLVSLLYTGQRPRDYLLLVPVAMALALLGVVLVRANRSRTEGAADATEVAEPAGPGRGGGRGSRAHLRLGLPVLSVVVLASLLLAQALPVVNDALRVDIPKENDPEVELASDISPLAKVKENLINVDNPVLFTVRFDGVAPDRAPDRVRIAALERYEGDVWNTAAKFPKVGREPPPGSSGARPTMKIDQTYRLQAPYRMGFLPALDRPVGIDSRDNVGFDRISGMLITDAPNPIEYSVTSDVPVTDEARFRAAAPGFDPVVADLAEPPRIRMPEIDDYARQSRFLDQPTTYDMLKAIEADMKGEGFGYNTRATAGHALGGLKRFLAADDDDGAAGEASPRVGYSEQFAASFALIARILRLPARVVVGYLINRPADAVGRDREVRANDIHAWVEVHLNGVGWVAFDGTNRQERPADPPPADQETSPPIGPPTTQPVPVPTSAVAAQPDTCETDGTGCADQTGGRAILWILLILLGLVALIVPIVIVVVKAVRRRRRHRRGTTAQRIVGAWREVLDRLMVNGVPTTSSMTAAELSDSLSTGGGDTSSRVAELGPLLDEALYSPGGPPEELVDRAWQAEAGVADALREQTGLRSRLRAAVDPRPLVGGRR